MTDLDMNMEIEKNALANSDLSVKEIKDILIAKEQPSELFELEYK